MAGRPRKTNESKKAEGTFRADRALEKYAKYEAVTILPEITKDLNEDGVGWFKHYCQVMIDQGLMTTAFITDFENAAYFYQSSKIAQRKLSKEGHVVKAGANGYKQISPYWKMLIEATKVLSEFSNKYGLNLSASQKINAPEIDSDKLDE